MKLTAEGTSDPGGDSFDVRWWIYPEASTRRDAGGRTFPAEVKLSADKGLTTSLVAPVVTQAETVHVICEVKDAGHPALGSYRRAILRIQPSSDQEYRPMKSGTTLKTRTGDQAEPTSETAPIRKSSETGPRHKSKPTCCSPSRKDPNSHATRKRQ